MIVEVQDGSTKAEDSGTKKGGESERMSFCSEKIRKIALLWHCLLWQLQTNQIRMHETPLRDPHHSGRHRRPIGYDIAFV